MANVALHNKHGVRMNIELPERLWPKNLKFLDDEDVKKITGLITKACSAATKQKARWYLDWAESLAYKALRKICEFSGVNRN